MHSSPISTDLHPFPPPSDAPANHPCGSAAAVQPLSPAHLHQLAAARHAARRILRTAAVARASAWTTAIFGGLTLLGLLFGDVPSLVLGSALLTVGIREARLSRRLARFDPASPRALALNQLALGAVLVVYASFQIWVAANSNGLSAANQPVGDPKVDAILADIGDLTRHVTILFYLAVALGGLLATSLMAAYYARRRADTSRFLGSTEPWIVDVLRTAA